METETSFNLAVSPSGPLDPCNRRDIGRGDPIGVCDKRTDSLANKLSYLDKLIVIGQLNPTVQWWAPCKVSRLRAVMKDWAADCCVRRPVHQCTRTKKT